MAWSLLLLHALLLIAVEGQDLKRAAKAPSPTRLWVSGLSAIDDKPAMEEGFRALRRAAPAQAAYLLSRAISITVLPAGEYTRRYSSASIAMTEGRQRIYVNPTYSADSALLAAVLAHETVHIQHGDRSHPASHHRLLYHVFWQSEEDEAHAAGVRVLTSLGRTHDAIRLENVMLLIRPLHGYATLFYLALVAYALQRRARLLTCRSSQERSGVDGRRRKNSHSRD